MLESHASLPDCPTPTLPGFSLAAIFSDHMVLQRDAPLPIWGQAAPGDQLTISLDDATGTSLVQTTTTVEAGQGDRAFPSGDWQPGGSVVPWMVTLPAQKAGGPYRLAVSSRASGQAISRQNVFIGEVWLAGGQSNMELELQNSLAGAQAVAHSEQPLIHFYNTPKVATLDDDLAQAEAVSSWQVCSPETSATLSAVAYYFARKVQPEVGVHLGIIDCYWGGTSVSCWMSQPALCSTPQGRAVWQAYQSEVSGKSEQQYAQEMAAYQQEWEAWDQRVQARRAMEPDVSWEVLNQECGECPWPQPMGTSSPYRPCGLYQTMVERVAPYTVKGFLWYQGEEDEKWASRYEAMFSSLIKQWRQLWALPPAATADAATAVITGTRTGRQTADTESINDDGQALPFYFVQLPQWISAKAYRQGVDNRHWPLIRQAQQAVADQLANTYMAVTLDCGEFDNIHPLDKQTVGERLAELVLHHTYRSASSQADAPSVRRVSAEGASLSLQLDQAVTGRPEPPDAKLVSSGNAAGNRYLAGFEVAGHDGLFYPAYAWQTGADSLSLVAPRVPQPVTARYAWLNWGPVSLVGKDSGLPLRQFQVQASDDGGSQS